MSDNNIPLSFDQLRIDQLLSTYGPDVPPSLPLEFSDYLSLLWRLDQTVQSKHNAQYYRRCLLSLGTALGLANREIGRLTRLTAAGELYSALERLPYQMTDRTIDAADRRAAIRQLLRLRADTLTIGVYGENWQGSWPGSGIIDPELHDRMFAILFTALPGQFFAFARLTLVADIVLEELLTGVQKGESVLMYTLVRDFGYPDPQTPETHALFQRD